MNATSEFPELDERGRAAAHDVRTRAADRPVPAFDPDRPVTVPLAPATSARTLNRPFLAAAAAAVAVALLGVGVWVGTRSDDTNDVADQLISGSIQPYLPEVVPEGLELAGVGETDGSVDDEMSLAASVGPLLTFGPAVDDPRLAVFATAERSFDSGSESASIETVGSSIDSENPTGSGDQGSETSSSDDTAPEPLLPPGAPPTEPEPADGAPREVAVGDRIGYLHEDSGLPGVMLEVPATDDPEGPVLTLFGPDVDLELLRSVALATTLDGLLANVDDDALPDDWRLLNVDPDGIGLVSPMGALRGASEARSTLAYYADGSQARSLIVSSVAGPAAAVHTQRLFLDSVETVTVRGHDAVVGKFPGGTSDEGEGVTYEWGESWAVRWEERPGEIVSLGGLGLTREELLAAAESIQPVDPTRWSELVEATALGDLSGSFGDDTPRIELGRGRFADGTGWVLRYSPEVVDGDSTRSEQLDLDVAIIGSSTSTSGSSFSSMGTAVDEDGNPIEAPAAVIRSTGSLETGGRAFAYGLVRNDVTRVEVRSPDGTVIGEAQLVSAEGVTAWVVEVGADSTNAVAFAADGTELGSTEIPRFDDGVMSSGPDSTIPAAPATTATN